MNYDWYFYLLVTLIIVMLYLASRGTMPMNDNDSVRWWWK